MPNAPNSILYIFRPSEDHPELPDLRILHVLTDAMLREIKDGHRVLVHCHKGTSRSGLFDAIVVMKLLHVDGKTAVEIVRKGRPEALETLSFSSYLESLPAPACPGHTAE